MIGLALCAALSANPGILAKSEVKVICDNADAIIAAAEKENVPVARLICVSHVETKWTSSVVGSSGECGVAQVLPTKRTTCASLKSVEVSMSRAASILGKGNMWYRLARSVCGKNKKCIDKHVLMGYNAGTAAAMGKGSKLNRATNYAAKVMRCEKQYERTIVP